MEPRILFTPRACVVFLTGTLLLLGAVIVALNLSAPPPEEVIISETPAPLPRVRLNSPDF